MKPFHLSNHTMTLVIEKLKARIQHEESKPPLGERMWYSLYLFSLPGRMTTEQDMLVRQARIALCTQLIGQIRSLQHRLQTAGPTALGGELYQIIKSVVHYDQLEQYQVLGRSSSFVLSLLNDELTQIQDGCEGHEKEAIRMDSLSH